MSRFTWSPRIGKSSRRLRRGCVMSGLPHLKRLFSSLYFQVLIAIVLGALLGYFDPELGTKLKPLGDGFIKLIKMLIGPIIFTTVVVGIAGMGDLRKIGRV